MKSMIRSFIRNLKRSIHRFFVIPSLKALKALPNNGDVVLVDIGAAGEVEPRWKPFTNSLNYVGFEPDERTRKIIRNQSKYFKTYQILPHALSNKFSRLKFNLCKKPQVSSLYQPNFPFLDKFPDPKRFEIEETVSVDCIPLDSIGLPRIDFLKIDIQGAENDVLKGATSTLDSILGLELEVEFLELYKGQPLFGDICKTLSEHNIEFMDFVSLARWERKAHNLYGQCIFGDALFLRSPETLIDKSLDVEKWSSYLAILIIYRRFDLIEVVLGLLPSNMKNNFHEFEALFEKIKKRERLLKRIHTYLNGCFSILGDCYRLHLIR